MSARQGDLIAIVVLFVAVNAALLAYHGVREGGDSPLYVDGGARLLDGRPLVDRQPSYVGYIYVVAATQALQIGALGLVMFQIVAGAIAAIAVYAIAASMAGATAGRIAAVLFSIDADTNRWNQFILADSLYVSLFVIAVWLVYRAAIQRSANAVIGSAVVLFVAALVRPEGWFLLPAAVCYLVAMRTRSTAQRLYWGIALCIAAGVFVAVLAPALGGNVNAVGPADMLMRGQTIWDFDGWRVTMPPSGVVADGQAGTAVAYALQHPFSTAWLMIARVMVHFAHVRPFYSTPHNLAIVVWLIPVYVAAVVAIRNLGFTALVSWLAIAIATQTLVVALTHAEWDGRYLAHVMPLIDTLVGAGVALTIAPRQSGALQPAHG